MDTQLRDLRAGKGDGPPGGPPRGPWPAASQGRLAPYSHSAWRGSFASPRPPRWHLARSRRASSPTKRVAPPGGVTFSSRPGSGSFSRFPGPRGHPPLRPGAPLPGIPAPTGTAPGRGRSRRARGLRAPRAAPRGPAARPFPSAPPRLPLFGSLARSLRRPVGPAGTGGAEEGRGCVPPARGRGGDPGACCQRAGEGRAAPLRRTPAPGGSALAEAVGAAAGGGGRAGPARKGREGRGEERGEACGEGLQARGRGSGDGEGAAAGPQRPGRASAPPPRRERSPRPGAALGYFAGHRNSGWLRGGEKWSQLAPTLALRLGADLCPFVPTFRCPSYPYPPDLFNEK